MRSAAGIVLVVSIGCGKAVAPPRPSVAPAPPSSAAVPVSTASAAAPPPDPPSRCERGALVDMTKVLNAIEGSFTRPGVHEMIGEMGCSPDGDHEWARVLARRGEDGVFEVELAEPEEPMHHDHIGGCQVLPTSVGRDLPICRLGAVSYGVVGQGVVALDYAADADHTVVSLVGVADTTDTACTGETELVVADVDRFELVDVDRDGNLDVRVTLHAGKFHVPRQPPCEHMGFAGSGQPPPKIPRLPAYTIDFIARGAALVPSPASAHVMKLLEKLALP